MSVCLALCLYIAYVIITFFLFSAISCFCKSKLLIPLERKLFWSGFCTVFISTLIYLGLKVWIFSLKNSEAEQLELESFSQLILISWGAIGGNLLAASLLKKIEKN